MSSYLNLTEGSQAEMGAPPLADQMVPNPFPCKYWSKDDCDKLGVYVTPGFIVEKGLLLKAHLEKIQTMQNHKGYLPVALTDILAHPAYERLDDGSERAPIDARFGTLIATITQLRGGNTIAGAKVLHSNPLSLEIGIPRQNSDINVVDGITGKTIGIVESSHISNGRTAFYAVLAFDKFLADKPNTKVFIQGSGAVAREIVMMLSQHAGKKISEMVICSPRSSQSFVDSLQSSTPFPMKAINDNQATNDLKEADFVITVTSNGKADPPVFPSKDCLKSNVVLLSLGTNEQPEDFLENVLRNGITVCDTVANVSGRNAQALALLFSRKGKTLADEAAKYTLHEIFSLSSVTRQENQPVLIACSGLATMDVWYALELLRKIARKSGYDFPY